jgi:hypothetical protein
MPRPPSVGRCTEDSRTRRRLPALVAAALAAGAVALAAGQGVLAGRAVPPAVRAAAERGLAGLLGGGDARALGRFGFRDPAEAARATVAEGFQVFTVPPDLLLANESLDLAAMATASTQWLFLVVSGGAPKVMLTVDRVNGTGTAVSVGGAEFAEDIVALLARRPASSHQHRLIRSNQAAAEMMEISRGGRVLGAVPFPSGRVSLRAPGPYDPSDLWPTTELTARLRPAVKAAMEQNRKK